MRTPTTAFRADSVATILLPVSWFVAIVANLVLRSELYGLGGLVLALVGLFLTVGVLVYVFGGF